MLKRLTLFLTITAMVAAVCPISAQDSAPTSQPAQEELDGTITLRWQIDSANDNYGFYLERSDTEDGPWTRVNERLIPGVGTSSDIHKFSFTDEGLVRGNDYFYKLYEVGYDGNDELMGTIPAHCRTVEEDIVHNRHTLLGEAVSEMDTVSSPIISGEFVAFLYPRTGHSVELLGEWSGWEDNPIEMKLLRGTQMWLAEEPVSQFESGAQVAYLYRVWSDEVSPHAVLDPNNAMTLDHQGREGEVSGFVID